MCDEIYRVLDTEADIYLKKEQDRIQVLYRRAINDAFGEMVWQMLEKIKDYLFEFVRSHGR